MSETEVFLSQGRTPVLSDHVRRGKSLVPKLVDQFPLELSSWIDDELPEVLWLALLNREYGWKRGAELAIAVAKSAAAVLPTPVQWWGLASRYAALSPEQWEQLKTDLSDDLADVVWALQPLVDNYPSFPMRGIGVPSQPAQEAAPDVLEGLEHEVESLFDPKAISATQAQGNALYVAFVTGSLTVSPGLALASFPELQRYPETELSRRVAASVRASMRMIQSTGTSTWPAEFWRRGIELTPCR